MYDYMAHIMCLDGNWTLAGQMIFNHLFTAVQYGFIAYTLWWVGNFADHNDGHWKSLFQSLSLVFVFCAANYVMNAVVIFTPLYYAQTMILWAGNAVFVKACWHLWRANKNALGSLMRAVKMAVNSDHL